MRFIAALLAAALPLIANGQAQLLPFGEFAARDGRPGPGLTFKVSDAQGARLAAQINAIASRTPIVIDYEHQALMAPQNGQPAPAAGWITSVEWRAGEGLFAQVDWTDRAKALIAAKEYRFISPAISTDDDGNVTGLLNAALVNLPAIVGMEAVVAQLSTFAQRKPLSHQETRVMDRDQLIAALGLTAGATDHDITAAITALRARPAIPVALSTALGIAATADEQTAVTALATLRSGGEASQLQAMTALQQQVNTLSAQLNDRNVTELVDGAIAALKLLPAQRDWALGLGRANLEQLRGYIASAVPMPGLAGQSNGKGNDGDSTALLATEADVIARMGITAEAYKAAKA